jgi:CTP:molybdopterin cytidylyltransferase MocA
VATVARASSIERVIVVLGAHADEISERVDLSGVTAVVCRDWYAGQAASLRTGIAHAGDADAVVVTLGDQPLIDTAAVERVVSAWAPGSEIVRATYAGEGGHPVLIARSLFDRVAELRADTGARALFGEAATVEVACDGLGRPDDVDTPEQLEALSV